MTTRDAVIALRRFGLGARPGECKAIAGDPRGYVRAGLARREGGLLETAGLRPGYVIFAEDLEIQRQKRLADQAQKAQQRAPMQPDAQGRTQTSKAQPQNPKVAALQPKPSEGGGGTGMRPEQAQQSAQPGLPKIGEIRRDVLMEEAGARFAQAVKTEAGFVERLVMFWSGHFCISADKGPVRGIAGAYEREAIRPHVLGRFVDMLVAAEMHPAMLIYLDNQVSIGPTSRAGNRSNKGLNENLAREILELHTLGADGGYTQDDVTNFARILTGWTVGGLDNPAAEPGKFFFAPARHEPGDWKVLGKRYADEGQRTGQKVLEDLARHPATARHIARKLVRHFVGDTAPAGLTERVQAVFLSTGGDLAKVASALVEAPEAWSAPPAKILPPIDFLIALARALGLEPKPQDLMRFSVQLGQPLWRPPSPKGWPDDDNAWTAPSALRERLRIVEIAVRQGDKRIDPRVLAGDLFADALGEHARTAVARAEVREQGLELLLMSPEFQRR